MIFTKCESIWGAKPPIKQDKKIEVVCQCCGVKKEKCDKENCNCCGAKVKK